MMTARAPWGVDDEAEKEVGRTVRLECERDPHAAGGAGGVAVAGPYAYTHIPIYTDSYRCI